MDPLTALGLASNVIQIVDVSTRIVSKGQSIYKSADGTLAENVDAEAVATDLNLLNTKLQHSLEASKCTEPLSHDDKSLMVLCGKCSALSNELLWKLNKLKVTGKHRKWKSARQALKSVAGKDDVQRFANRLAVYREEINFNITVSLRGRLDLISSQQSKRFDDLDNFSRAILDAVLNRTTDIMNALPSTPQQPLGSNFKDLHQAAQAGDRSRLRIILSDKELEMNVRDVDGQTALHLASAGGHGLLIQTLINHKVELEAENNKGQTALHCAAANGRWAALRILLTNGANKEAEDDEQRTPLYYALLSRNDDHGVCDWIFRNGHDINARDDHGDSLLLYAVHRGLEALVRFLLDKGADIEMTGGAGASPLIVAAGQGKRGVVRLLLDRDARIEATDPNQSTALIRAAWKGHISVVRILLDQGANVQAKNAKGQSPLNVALNMYDHEEMVQLLVKRGAIATGHLLFRASEAGRLDSIGPLVRGGADIEWKAHTGDTVLIVSARRDRPSLVQALIQNGADTEAEGNGGETALIVAVQEGHDRVIEMLLGSRADIECISHNGTTPLMMGSFRDRPVAVKVLLQHGAQTEARRNDGATALWIAAEQGHRQIVEILLDSGAEIESKGQGYSPLNKASQLGHLLIVQMLLDRGADLESSNPAGLTALHEAVWNHETKIVALLVSKGADIESRDAAYGGLTPLIRAVANDHYITARVLLELGADLEEKSRVCERSALAEAVGHGSTRLVSHLLRCGADIETRNRKGRTPLMHAARLGNEDIVRLLLRYGAFRGAKDQTGMTALTFATKEHRDEIVELLR